MKRLGLQLSGSVFALAVFAAAWAVPEVCAAGAAPAALSELEGRIKQAVAKARPAVVSISTFGVHWVGGAPGNPADGQAMAGLVGAEGGADGGDVSPHFADQSDPRAQGRCPRAPAGCVRRGT